MNQPVCKFIGEYRFYSPEEYKKGLNDLKKIKTLSEKGNLINPKLAGRLYQQLLSYPDMFESIIGEEFIGKLLHCSNGYPERLDTLFSSILDNYNRGALKSNDKDIPDTDKNIFHKEQESSYNKNIKAKTFKGAIKNKKNHKKGHKKNFKREILIFLAGILTCVILYTLKDSIEYKLSTDRSIKKLKVLAAQILEPIDSIVSDEHKDMDKAAGDRMNADNRWQLEEEYAADWLDDGQGDIKQKKILHQYSILYGMNQDITGWIKIDGTVIDYPVMQTKEDEEYYLYRDFDKETDVTGLPFMAAGCDIVEPTSNYLIHGHNMKNGTMFAPLLNYKQEEFYKKHMVIQFDTIFEAAEYEIVSVFQSRVAYQHEDVFRYYYFIDAKKKEEYDAFIKEIKELSYYDTGITPEYGEQLITLSTCDRSIEDGRLVVVARKITNDSQP